MLMNHNYSHTAKCVVIDNRELWNSRGLCRYDCIINRGSIDVRDNEKSSKHVLGAIAQFSWKDESLAAFADKNSVPRVLNNNDITDIIFARNNNNPIVTVVIIHVTR